MGIYSYPSAKRQFTKATIKRSSNRRLGFSSFRESGTPRSIHSVNISPETRLFSDGKQQAIHWVTFLHRRVVFLLYSEVQAGYRSFRSTRKRHVRMAGTRRFKSATAVFGKETCHRKRFRVHVLWRGWRGTHGKHTILFR